jgi:predicted AAA+ superfamily ATPase
VWLEGVPQQRRRGHEGLIDVRNPWIWGTRAGAELDLLVDLRGKRVGIDVKRTEQPKLTPSMRHALVDLELDRLLVVHAGTHRFPLAETIEAVPAREVLVAGRDTR